MRPAWQHNNTHGYCNGFTQETEEALEELRSKYRDTKTCMDAEVSALAGQVEALQESSAAAQAKSKRLKDRCVLKGRSWLLYALIAWSPATPS
jgi:hypothetical protein